MQSVSEMRLEDVIASLCDGDRGLAQKLRASILAARVDPEDPVAVMLAINHREELRMRAFDATAKRHIQELTMGLTDLPAKMSGQFGHAMTETLRAECQRAMPRIIRRLRWPLVGLILAALLAALLLSAGAGYILGRQETFYAAQTWAGVASAPDAAGWLKLQQLNPHLPAWIATACTPGAEAVYLSNGRSACTAYLWVEGDAWGTWGWLSYLKSHPAFGYCALLSGIAVGGAMAWWAGLLRPEAE